jgi:hypothetical protein
MEWASLPDAKSIDIAYFEISRCGRARSVDNFGNIRLLNRCMRNGIWCSSIAGKLIDMHRLVALAWLPKPIEADDTWTVDHIISSDFLNNSVENLRWVSKTDQSLNRRLAEDTRIDSCPLIATCIKDTEAFKNSYGIIDYKYKKNDVLYFESAYDAEYTLKVDKGCISKCLYKQRKSAGGFSWSTPDMLPDLHDETWINIHESSKYCQSISSKGRIGYLFNHGYFKKISSSDKITLRTKTEKRSPYPSISFADERWYLHRLIWSKFIGPIPDDMEVHHKDNDKLNASLDNLELVSSSQNKIYAHDDGTFIGTAIERKPIVINGITYKCVADAHRITGEAIYTIKNRLKSVNFQNYDKLSN